MCAPDDTVKLAFIQNDHMVEGRQIHCPSLVFPPLHDTTARNVENERNSAAAAAAAAAASLLLL